MERLSSEPFARTGYNLDRNEDGTPCTSQHDCLDFLEFHESTSVEPHGEQFTDGWYECSVCGEKYTEYEVDRMYDPTMPVTPAPACVECGSERKAVAIERTLSHQPAAICCKQTA